MNANIEMPVFRGPASSVPRVGPACPLPAAPGLPVRSVNGHWPDRTGAVTLVLGDLVDPGPPGAARTLADYNISDAKIEDGVITLGPASVALSDFAPASRLSGHLADLFNPHQVTKSQVGLGNVDNTSDMAKPVSTAQQDALDRKADKSDVYTRSETVTQIAGKIAEIVAGAPASFDTLKEIADWIQSDTTGAAKMSSDIETLKSGKQAKITASGLLKGDGDGGVSAATKSDVTALGVPGQDTTYGPAVPSESGVGGTAGLMSAADKEKLDGVEAGAEANVQPNWTQDDADADDFIKNKPTTMPPAAHTHAQTDVTGLEGALALRPTKAQMDAGWLSDWKVFREGVDVTDQVGRLPVWVDERPFGFYGWDYELSFVPTDRDDGSLQPPLTGEFDSLSLAWTGADDNLDTVHYTATRHRVAAPVPTKPSDIGAASVADATLTPIYSDTPTFSEWTIKRDGVDVTSQVQQPAYGSIVEDVNGWSCPVIAGDNPVSGYAGINESDAISLSWSTTLAEHEPPPTFTYTATRVRTDIIGYTLGSQSDKKLQPKGDYALLAQLYEAVRNLAPDFTAKAYALNELCTYNGVFYRCKSAYMADAQSSKPDADTTHWEAKKVSGLFLPLTGGQVSGTLTFMSNRTFSGSFEGSSNGVLICASGLETALLDDIVAMANGHLSVLGVPGFSTTATYAAGAKVVHDNAVWNCTAAVSTAGAWTGTTNWAKLFDLDTGAPASGGTKLVTNGQVHTALQGKADADDLRYDLPANAIAISSASSEVVEGETVIYGAATLADRTANRVAITAAIAELRLTFPAAVSGKVRDFGLRMEVGDGTTALTAPALVPPAGVTLENSDGAMPALADGSATAKGVTLLYFSETAPGVFLVKGEEVKEA